MRAGKATNRPFRRALLFVFAIVNFQNLLAQDLPNFKVPPGFTVERISGPLVDWPMFACFDDQGRLYVAESSGQKDKPHRILVLEDVDRNGRFGKSHVFADGIAYASGIVWHDGAIYCASPPGLWKFEDTQGSGVADKRQELVTGWPLTGISDELHGPSIGPDGRLYWGCGRFHYEIHRPGGPILAKGRAPVILRCRTDGSDFEIFSGAQGNPVKLAFTPEGELFACGTWGRNPWAIGANGRPGRQDLLIHCVEGGNYPMLDGDFYGAERPRTGTDLLPPISYLGVAAACGVTTYRSEAFGAEYNGNLFSALYNMHKIVRHVMAREGSTFRSRDEDFLVCDQPDFHPTDLLEDADGSLLVVDTGSWFDHCPTSTLGKSRPTGGIYRIRNKDAPVTQDPRGLAIAWGELSPAELLPFMDDPRFTVRDRAISEFARRGNSAVPALCESVAKGNSTRLRQNAVWALTRIEGAEARAGVRAALGDGDADVRHAATISAGLYRDRDALSPLIEIMKTGSAPLKRDAATALGRIGQVNGAAALLEAVKAGGDRFLEHALVYALIRIADRPSALEALKDPAPCVRAVTLLALDQMVGGNLTIDLVLPQLDPRNADLERTALAIVARHPEWGREMVGPLRGWLAEGTMDENRRTLVRTQLLAFIGNQAIQDLIANSLANENTPLETRLLLLEVIGQAPLQKLPITWAVELNRCLAHRDERVVRQAIATLRRASGVLATAKTKPGAVDEFGEALLALARDAMRPDDLRAEAALAAAPRVGRMDADLFTFLVACLDRRKPPLLRQMAANALGKSPLDQSQLTALIGTIATAGSLELPHLIAPFIRSKDEATGQKLVAALLHSPAVESLGAQQLTDVLKDYPPAVKTAAGALLKRLEGDLEAQRAKLAELEPLLKNGDPDRGRQVFLGVKTVCTACHTVQGQGGKVGPELTKIGSIRAPRDLLESIVFPSATIVRGYEPYTIKTNDGTVSNGIIARETADAIYLYDAQRIEMRILKNEIKSIKEERISIMPQGLDALLAPGDLADLVAFLQSLK